MQVLEAVASSAVGAYALNCMRSACFPSPTTTGKAAGAGRRAAYQSIATARIGLAKRSPAKKLEFILQQPRVLTSLSPQTNTTNS